MLADMPNVIGLLGNVGVGSTHASCLDDVVVAGGTIQHHVGGRCAFC